MNYFDMIDFGLCIIIGVIVGMELIYLIPLKMVSAGVLSMTFMSVYSMHASFLFGSLIVGFVFYGAYCAWKYRYDESIPDKKDEPPEDWPGASLKDLNLHRRQLYPLIPLLFYLIMVPFLFVFYGIDTSGEVLQRRAFHMFVPVTFGLASGVSFVLSMDRKTLVNVFPEKFEGGMYPAIYRMNRIAAIICFLLNVVCKILLFVGIYDLVFSYFSGISILSKPVGFRQPIPNNFFVFGFGVTGLNVLYTVNYMIGMFQSSTQKN